MLSVSVGFVFFFRLHHRMDDLGQDGLKQGNFGRGYIYRPCLESNIGLDGFAHSFWHLLSCMCIPARSIPFHVL